MVKDNRRQDMVVIASEPLTFEKADWLTIPTNSIMVVTSKMNVLIYPIIDEYHNPTSRWLNGVDLTVPVVADALVGENLADMVKVTENQEVTLTKDQVQISSFPPALSVETNILAGPFRSSYDSGSSVPSTPSSPSRSSSYMSSLPSASSISMSFESFCLPTVPSYTKPSGEDSVDEEYNASDSDHGHEADSDDDGDSDNDIEEDYRIFPSKKRRSLLTSIMTSPIATLHSPSVAVAASPFL
jgi:hypothetical protein